MNTTIIDNINRKATRNDLLYIIGDFAFRSRTSPIEFLEAIKPKKILIVGNHDRDWLKKLTEEEKQRYFVGIYDRYSIKRNGLELHFNHFPQLAWSRSHYFAQSFSICGHIHNARDTTIAARLFPYVDCQFNAGIDINGFEPVTFAELVERNHAFYGRTYDAEQQKMLAQAIAKLM
jgi:calcineurin-like phosphoesterase family protein